MIAPGVLQSRNASRRYPFVFLIENFFLIHAAKDSSRRISSRNLKEPIMEFTLVFEEVNSRSGGVYSRFILMFLDERLLDPVGA
jgi:hypothetical protein